MSDDKVLVSRDLIRRLIFSGALLTEDELEEEVCALMTAPAHPSDAAASPEPFFYAMCGPDGKPHYQECCVSAKAHHLEPDADGVTVIPVYRHAPAQPKPTCTCPSGDGSLRWPCPVHPPEVKALALPERRSAIDTFTTYGLGGCNGWNACLDRVKELNS